MSYKAIGVTLYLWAVNLEDVSFFVHMPKRRVTHSALVPSLAH